MEDIKGCIWFIYNLQFHTRIDIIWNNNELIELLHFTRTWLGVYNSEIPITVRFKDYIPVGIKRTGTVRTKIIPKKGNLSHNVGKAACRNYEIFLWDQNNKVKRKLENLLDMVSRAHKEGAPSWEPVFVNVYGARQSIPKGSISPGWESIPGLLKIFLRITNTGSVRLKTLEFQRITTQETHVHLRLSWGSVLPGAYCSNIELGGLTRAAMSPNIPSHPPPPQRIYSINRGQLWWLR